MEYPISEILDRYSIAVLKKQRLDADNDIELNDLSEVIEEYKKINSQERATKNKDPSSFYNQSLTPSLLFFNTYIT